MYSIRLQKFCAVYVCVSVCAWGVFVTVLTYFWVSSWCKYMCLFVNVCAYDCMHLRLLIVFDCICVYECVHAWLYVSVYVFSACTYFSVYWYVSIVLCMRVFVALYKKSIYTIKIYVCMRIQKTKSIRRNRRKKLNAFSGKFVEYSLQ